MWGRTCQLTNAASYSVSWTATPIVSTQMPSRSPPMVSSIVSTQEMPGRLAARCGVPPLSVSAFFLLFIEPELKRNEVQRAPAPTKPDMRPITSIECLAGPGEFHNHQVPPRDLVEYATIRWGCRLRVILHHAEETNMQSVEFVVSSWPHKLSVSIQSIKNRL